MYSKSLEGHISNLDIPFHCLMTNRFFLNRNKCLFSKESIKYLRHIISNDGVGLDPKITSNILSSLL